MARFRNLANAFSSGGWVLASQPPSPTHCAEGEENPRQTWMWYKSSPTSWKHEQIWTCKCQLRQTYIYSASFTVSQWLLPNKLRPTLVINRLRITKWQCSPIRSRSQPSKRKCYKAKLCQKMCYKVKPHQKSAKKSNLARMKLPVTPVLQAQKP